MEKRSDSERRVTRERRQLNWRSVVGYIVVFVIVGALAAAIISNSNAISDQVDAVCFGGATRTVQQLLVDYAIYEADVEAAKTYREDGQDDQAKIRQTEADKLLVAMKKIAAVRIDADLAPLLPKSLADVVTKVGFQCSDVDRKLP